MQITIKLETISSQLSAAGAAVIFGGLMIWWTLNQFVITALSDPRVSVNQATLTAAAKYFPASSQLQSRLAARLIESANEENETEEKMLTDAEQAAQRAVRLAHWNYENYLLLAAVLEQKGDLGAAETAMNQALRLAPNYADVQWQAGNLFLRTDKLSAAQQAFQQVLMRLPARAPQIFSALWNATDGNANCILQTAQANAASKIAGALFLLQQNHWPEAKQLLAQTTAAERLSATDMPQIFTGLLEKKQLALARENWEEIFPSEEQGKNNLLWNGSFEIAQPENFPYFAWQFLPNKFAKFEINSDFAKLGKSALQIQFTGLDTTRLQGNIQQLLALSPKQRYVLRYAVRTINFHSVAPLQIAILSQPTNAVIAACAPVPTGTNDWQLMQFEFTTPPNLDAAWLAIQRIPQFSYDEPTTGSVWFDDFVLTQK